MKTSRKLIGGLLVLLVLVGTAGLALCRLYVQQRDSSCEQLAVEGHCQTDVLGPFIQKNRLTQFPPDEASRNDFRAYLESQVAAKRLAKPEAESVLATLESAGGAMPVYTTRGWVMPIIAQGFQ